MRKIGSRKARKGRKEDAKRFLTAPFLNIAGRPTLIAVCRHSPRFCDKIFSEMQSLPEMFAPYERLIEIEILGESYQVPENNSILRCLQFLDIEAVSNADLCWNGECLLCQVSIQNGDKERSVIACRTDASEEMKIVRLSKDIPFGQNRLR
ncbi:MAG TPA: 2Fe-2S iron-sulfur cluster-binding protein [Pyrinomonadaceae bacterium]